MSRIQRKQNYVDKHVQGALLQRIFFHWCIFFFVVSMSVVMLQALLGDPAQTLGERLKYELGEFIFLGVILVALFPAFMLDTIRFSNRFVGPIARLRRHLRQLSEGNTERCKFRENDYWSEMAGEFNGAAELFEKQREELESKDAEIARLKSALNSAGITARS
jgi:hypothetical protein